MDDYPMDFSDNTEIGSLVKEFPGQQASTLKKKKNKNMMDIFFIQTFTLFPHSSRTSGAHHFFNTWILAPHDDREREMTPTHENAPDWLCLTNREADSLRLGVLY